MECNLCGWQGRYLRRGLHAEERHCPRCKSSNRHRLIAWYLDHAGLLPPGGTILHVAPEPALAGRLEARAGAYETCDLARCDVDYRLDLQTGIVAVSRYDLIVINHVLEHVPDDRAVLRNLRRMLKDGGTCLVTVPMRADGGATDEDAGVTDSASRRARFGQDDHVRLYGPDLTERLEQAGFAASSLTSGEVDDAAVARYSLQKETLFLGKRMVGQEGAACEW